MCAERNEWTKLNTTGSKVSGGYGHTSVYDEVMNKVYVFGGYHSRPDTPGSSYNLTDTLYVLNLDTREWSVANTLCVWVGG
jgi:hypothetical protein